MEKKLLTPVEIAEDRDSFHRWVDTGFVWKPAFCGYWLMLQRPVLGGLERSNHYRLFTLRPELNPGVDDVWAWTDALVDRAYDVGVRLWGERWRAHADAPAVDVAVQIAVFGEVRYG